VRYGGNLPRRILFYRDGVSESQYGAIRLKEIPQLKKAYEWADMCLKSRTDPHMMSIYQQEANDPDDQPESDLPAIQSLTVSETTQEPSGTPGGLSEKKTIDEVAQYGLEEALERLCENPFELTYVVVGKRHNTRFYPTSAAQDFQVGNYFNGNVQPGLCVDEVSPTHTVSTSTFSPTFPSKGLAAPLTTSCLRTRWV
jgi:hypothetical protein